MNLRKHVCYPWVYTVIYVHFSPTTVQHKFIITCLETGKKNKDTTIVVDRFVELYTQLLDQHIAGAFHHFGSNNPLHLFASRQIPLP